MTMLKLTDLTEAKKQKYFGYNFETQGLEYYKTYTSPLRFFISHKIFSVFFDLRFL